MYDFIATIFDRRLCNFDWRFEILSRDGAAKGVYCVTGIKGLRILGETECLSRL